MRTGKLTIQMCSRIAPLAVGLATLVAASPASAAFPGVPGPIAYSHVKISEGDDTGGLRVHGPRRQDSPKRLTDSRGDSSPSYSPNGRLIVFSGNRDPGAEPKGSHIYLMKRGGSGITQLSSGDFVDSNPSFSADGKLVVFDRGGLQGRATHIFSVATDGNGLKQITDNAGSDSDPVFMPDGRRIVFESNRMSSGRTDRTNILSMRPDGSQMRLVIGGRYQELDPDVSPNGRKIAFTSNRDHGPNLFVARINGKHLLELTHTRHSCTGSACYTNASWSPDGTHIAFLSTGRYSTGITVIRADGRDTMKEFDGGSTETEGFGDRVGAPGWGPRPR